LAELSLAEPAGPAGPAESSLAEPAESSWAELSVAERVEEMELEQPERAAQARRSGVTSRKAIRN
jgi:hypothetical protein